MQITVKVLKGQDLKLEVETTTTILEMKKEIENKLKIPLAEQKLLLFGRTLSDDNTVSSYPNICDGSKLNLVVMRPRIEGLREVIQRSFSKYYNDQQTEKLVTVFMSDFEANLKQMSWDDIDRLSENLISA
ncbi:ubiquitin-like protein 4A [Anastrepha obliqua]|uniref:ubiquitin-like protein 4A n=1 Tax=Anastrepha obliqua TaxID=95512 RepID=UPI00240A3B28|nr:ubiquitin-like protein 4A [Anastrepha obliqua]